MHGSRTSNAALLEGLLAQLGRPAGAEVAVCVPYPYLEQVSKQLAGTPIAWGAQNVNEHAQGAYTGEVSAAMIREFGCRYVIVGHSERRPGRGEVRRCACRRTYADPLCGGDAGRARGRTHGRDRGAPARGGIERQ